MKTRLFVICLGLLVSLPVARAQQAVPELEFESVADFLKPPADVHFGEVSGVAVNSRGHVFVFTRSASAGGPAYAPSAAQLLEFGPKGEFIREVGKGNYGWSFAHTVRIDKDDNIWAVDKGSDMVIKFTPAGRIVEVYGRRKESADDEAEAVGAPQPAAAADRRPVPPADRRGVGLAGEHLHLRRLHQLARRQVRQGRRLGEVVGRARHRPGPVQHAARDCRRPQRQRLRGRPRQPPHPGVRHRRQVPAACSPSTCRRRRGPSR